MQALKGNGGLRPEDSGSASHNSVLAAATVQISHGIIECHER